jgi:hypothetical protein
MQPTEASSVHAPDPPIQETSEEIHAKSSILQATRTSVQATPHLQKKTPHLQKETPQSVREPSEKSKQVEVTHRVLMSCTRKRQKQHNLRMTPPALNFLQL